MIYSFRCFLLLVRFTFCFMECFRLDVSEADLKKVLAWMAYVKDVRWEGKQARVYWRVVSALGNWGWVLPCLSRLCHKVSLELSHPMACQLSAIIGWGLLIGHEHRALGQLLCACRAWFVSRGKSRQKRSGSWSGNPTKWKTWEGGAIRGPIRAAEDWQYV